MSVVKTIDSIALHNTPGATVFGNFTIQLLARESK
jgi:hypothetical protein